MGSKTMEYKINASDTKSFIEALRHSGPLTGVKLNPRKEKDMCDEELTISDAIIELAKSVRVLGGFGDAHTPGPIEGLAMLIRDSNEKIANSLDGISSAILEIADKID